MWRRLAQSYRKKWGVDLYAVDAEGHIVFGRPACRGPNADECCASRRLAILEAHRWGEACVKFCPRGRMLWAVPLMNNEIITGGIIASVAEKVFLGRSSSVSLATIALRELLEKNNLTNASALSSHRERYLLEQDRAYALHMAKEMSGHGIRELYLREEPALFAAIRAGDRGEARGIINRILIAIHHHAGSRLELIKSHLLELVASMVRTAVTSGGSPDELLGANYTWMSKLSRIDNEEGYCHWLRSILEHIMDHIERQRRSDTRQRLFNALAFMERRCHEAISRDDAARAAHLSPSHFSMLLRKESGATFTELRNRLRIDRAVDLLLRTEQPLARIAAECGFSDQSYFTKVFRRYRKQTPLAFRRAERGENGEQGKAKKKAVKPLANRSRHSSKGNAFPGRGLS